MHGSLVVMLLAVLILGLVGGKALGGSGDPGSSGASPVHYRIPPEFIVTRENMDKIDVVSSHGRTDASSQGQPGSPTPSATSLQLALRCAYLCLIFSPAIATSGLAMISVLFRTHVWFWILSRSIAISGAAFIKWGQWASTRPDIFPPELCRALAELQASAPEHSLAFTRQAIERELGLPLERVFESFSERPIASGSIAQVYRARLNGQDVAVKVRHPHVREHIEMDFVLMKALARWIEALPGFGWLTLSDSMAQFSVTIASQVALDAEGKHLYVFNRNFRSMPDVRFPKTVFFTDSVLVETFEKGESVAKYIDVVTGKGQPQQEGGAEAPTGSSFSSASAATVVSIPNIHNSGSREEILFLSHFIVTRGEDAYLKMLLTDNLMHADLHPGNILVQSPGMFARGKGGKGDKGQGQGQGRGAEGRGRGRAAEDPGHRGPRDYRIVMVDAGMVARLTRQEQRNFIGLLTAMGEGNGRDAARHLLRFSVASQHHSAAQRAAFEGDMTDLFAQVCRGYGRNTDIGEALRGILNLCRVHKVSIDANYATLVMNALCLDGMAKLLLPQYNVLDSAEGLLKMNKWVSRVPFGLGGVLRRLLLPLGYLFKKRHDKKFCC